MIVSSHLSKRYRKKLAVDDLSFEVADGKVTGFLGPNGAGKSTTMRLMLGLDKGQGTTLFDGKQLKDYGQPGRIVGILLEAKAFHPTRSARNHLRTLADAAGLASQRVEAVLDQVGLTDVAGKAPGKFSLGMSQRLGIAAAILAEPKYLLLDEPANGLDPEGVAWLRQFLKDYADKGNAVFVSSHLLSEMALMADDVVVIGKGKLIASASVEQLTSGNGHAKVYVRVPQLAKLESALHKAKLEYRAVDHGLEVAHTSTDAVGSVAFAAGLPVLELTNRNMSLETAFLELTGGAQEYQTHTQSGNAEPSKEKTL